MEATEAIASNASYHNRLLEIITELGYIPSARKQQASYVKDIDEGIAKANKRVNELAEKTKKERKEYQTLRDSTARRFAHLVVGKKQQFEAKASKEEREFAEALEQEMTEKDNLAMLTRLREEAQIELDGLKEKEKLFDSAQLELQALYGRVFDGPTLEFPEDDRLEYEFNATIRRHEEVQRVLNAESKAAELLARGKQALEACQRSVQEALSHSQYDMWGGGSFADMLERSALRNAQSHAYTAETLVNQASQISSHVRPIGPIHIAEGNLVSDVLFDNIFSDLAFHNKIKASATRVYLANGALKGQLDDAIRRVEAEGGKLMQVAYQLDQCRKELYAFRKATFQSYVEQHPPPPDYDAAVQPKAAAGQVTMPEPQHCEGGDQSVLNQPSVSTSPSPLPARSGPQDSSVQWGKRNPYAAAMAQRTRSMSQD